jgi:hypothetical protein
MVGLAAFIPSVLSVLGSLFKGKKTKQAPQQTPQQLAAYTQLLQMLTQRNKMGSDPMNQVRNMFYGQQPQPTQTRTPGTPYTGFTAPR